MLLLLLLEEVAEWGGRGSNNVLFWPKYVLPGPTDIILWLGIPGTPQNDCCNLLFWCCRLMNTGMFAVVRRWRRL